MLGSGQQVKLANPLARLGARVVDLLILGSPLHVAGAAFDSGDFSLLAAAVLLEATLLYEVALIAFKGQTLGKMLFDVKDGMKKPPERWSSAWLNVAGCGLGR